MQQLRSAVRRFAQEFFFYTGFVMAISVKKKLY